MLQQGREYRQTPDDAMCEAGAWIGYSYIGLLFLCFLLLLLLFCFFFVYFFVCFLFVICFLGFFFCDLPVLEQCMILATSDVAFLQLEFGNLCQISILKT